MRHNLVLFLILFLGVMTATYFTQNWVTSHFELEQNQKILDFSYLFNTLSAILLVAGILLIHKKYNDQIGFVFMIGSFLKLGIFLVIIKWNGLELSKSVFLDFFMAYVVSLTLEVYWVAKVLSINK